MVELNAHPSYRPVMGGRHAALILAIVVSAKAVKIAVLPGGDWAEQFRLAAAP